MKSWLRLSPALALLLGASPAFSQIIGSFDNFDCVNDTGETAEGYEIDIEDVSVTDIVRAFPSNFSTQPYVSRFGIPDMVPFDNTASGGHKGVSVIWHANWDGTRWVAKYGNVINGTVGPAGNGVAYVAKPMLTQGDQCWLLGQGNGYANSGCDHFGISYGPGASPGKVSYHWLVPDPANVGKLIPAPWQGGVAPIAPMPAYAYVPPAAGGLPVVHAVGQAPELPDPAYPQWGDAQWVKTYTSYTKAAPDLDALQANVVPVKAAKGVKVTTRWALLQRPPAGVVGEKEDVEDDGVDIAQGYVAAVKRYEYYQYTGIFDPETHEAICGPEKPNSNGPCTSGPQNYVYVDPETGLSQKVKEKGKFMGAHNDAVQLH